MTAYALERNAEWDWEPEPNGAPVLIRVHYRLWGTVRPWNMTLEGADVQFSAVPASVKAAVEPVPAARLVEPPEDRSPRLLKSITVGAGQAEVESAIDGAGILAAVRLRAKELLISVKSGGCEGLLVVQGCDATDSSGMVRLTSCLKGSGIWSPSESP